MSATTWLIIAIVGFSLSGIALTAAVFMFIKMNIPAIIGDLTGKTVAKEIKAMRDANESSGNKIHKSSSVNINRGKLTEKVKNEGSGGLTPVAHASKRLDRTGSGRSASLQNEEKGHTSGNSAKGRTTESLSANVDEVDIEARRATAVLDQNRVTDVLGETKKTDILSDAPEEVIAQSRQTEVLAENNQTEVLAQPQQTEILVQPQQTEVLSQSYRTELLTYDELEYQGEATSVLSETEAVVQEAVVPVAFKITRSVIEIHTDEVVG